MMIQFNNSTAPQTVPVDFGMSGSFDGLTGIGGFEGLRASSGVFAPSVLLGVQVDGDGTVVGVTSTGRLIPLVQLVIASFVDADGLLAVGRNMFTESLSSGASSVGTVERPRQRHVKTAANVECGLGHGIHEAESWYCVVSQPTPKRSRSRTKCCRNSPT